MAFGVTIFTSRNQFLGDSRESGGSNQAVQDSVRNCSQLAALKMRLDPGIDKTAFGVRLHAFLEYPLLNGIVDVSLPGFEEPDVEFLCVRIVTDRLYAP